MRLAVECTFSSRLLSCIELIFYEKFEIKILMELQLIKQIRVEFQRLEIQNTLSQVNQTQVASIDFVFNL